MNNIENIIKHGIQYGENTHHQDQFILLVNFNIEKIITSKVKKLIPDFSFY